MKYLNLTLIVATASLAACGGGTSGSSTAPYGAPPVRPPVATPTPAQTPTPVATVLATATINGGAAFVNGLQHAVYTFDGDTVPNQSTCTGGCASIWPPVPPPGGALPVPWASFKRPDGSQQLSYKGKPLYTFVSDTQPDVATGDGVQGFHLARP